MPTNSAVSTLAASPPNPDMISHRPRDSALVSHESTGYASANENDEDNNSDLGEVVSADDYNARTQSSACLLYTSPSPRDKRQSRMPSSA